MTRIVFLKTDYFYQSYVDFWKMVELSGFPIMPLSEFNWSLSGIFIISPYNGELCPHLDGVKNKNRQARLILWDLERPAGRGGFEADAQLLNFLVLDNYVDEVWSSDRWAASELGTKFVVLGSHSELGEPSLEKDFDYCHMSYVNSWRNSILSGNTLKVGPNCWGEERDKILKTSKFGLMTHQDEDLVQEPLRLALFAAYGLPIVSESCEDAFPWADLAVFSGRDTLLQTLQSLLDEPYAVHQECGKRLRQLMTSDYQFGKVVRAAV